MKHLGRVSAVQVINAKAAYRRPGYDLGLADAKTDFMNAIWRAWGDYVYQKKNEVSV